MNTTRKSPLNLARKAKEFNWNTLRLRGMQANISNLLCSKDIYSNPKVAGSMLRMEVEIKEILRNRSWETYRKLLEKEHAEQSK